MRDRPTNVPPAAALAALSLLLVLAAGSGAQEPQTEHQGHEHHGDHGNAHDEPVEYVHHELRHDFSDAEHWSKMFDSAERAEWQKPGEVVAAMEIEPGMTVADLGAGTGFFLGPLAAAVGDGGRVLGLDVESNLVAYMTERAVREGWANVEARKVPFDDPGLGAGAVDRVLIVNTWHHIEERAAYAAKLLAALKPGGRVYVVDFTKESPSGPPEEHRLEPQQIVEELSAGGLEAELVEEVLPRQFIVVGRRK